MAAKEPPAETIRRKLSSQGQITVPASMRQGESEYLVRDEGEKIVLFPVDRPED